jgi:hypothetical protein
MNLELHPKRWTTPERISKFIHVQPASKRFLSFAQVAFVEWSLILASTMSYSPPTSGFLWSDFFLWRKKVSYDLNVGKRWMRTRTHKIIFESNRNQQGEMRTSSMIASNGEFAGLDEWLVVYVCRNQHDNLGKYTRTVVSFLLNCIG